MIIATVRDVGKSWYRSCAVRLLDLGKTPAEIRVLAMSTGDRTIRIELFDHDLANFPRQTDNDATFTKIRYGINELF